MAGISIISNFDLNQSVPIDSRLVASSSVERDAIIYKYSGLKVYQKDINRTWTWNGTGWDAEGSGIYGGSGSIIGDTYVSFGTVSNPVTSKSRELIFVGEMDGVGKTFLHNNFYRSDNAVSSFEYKDVEFRTQYKYFDGTNTSNGPYIVYNVNPQGSDTSEGGISFNTGFDTFLSERLRITAGGRVGIGTTDPRGNLQIGPTTSAIAKPLVFLSSSPPTRQNSAVIGHNWYPSTNLVTDFSFDQAIGSTKLVFVNGIFRVQNRAANSTTYNDTLSVGTNSRVGIMTTTPRTELDVNGAVMTKKLELTLPTGVTTSTFINSTGFFPYQLTIGGFGTVVSTTHSYYQTNNFYVIGDNGQPGSITNVEPSINLNVTEINVAFTNTAGFNSQRGLNFFTYSVSAYRIGALVHMDVELRTTNNVVLELGASPTVGPFFGFSMTVQSTVDPTVGNRFVPTQAAYGSGHGGTFSGATATSYNPLIIEAFTIDPTGGKQDPLTGTDFYVRFRTVNTSGLIGNQFRITTPTANYIPTNTVFRGSVTYKV